MCATMGLGGLGLGSPAPRVGRTINRIRGFQEGTSLAERDGMRIFTAVAFILVSGCTGDLVEIGAGHKGDMAMAGGGGDMAQGAGGDAGQTALKFSPDIQMDLDAKGCTIMGCHGTAGGTAVPTIKMGATAQADIDANYAAVMGEVNTTSPAQSLLLTKPLATSQITHQGTKPFTNEQDPTYVRWLNWIQAGAPK